MSSLAKTFSYVQSRSGCSEFLSISSAKFVSALRRTSNPSWLLEIILINSCTIGWIMFCHLVLKSRNPENSKVVASEIFDVHPIGTASDVELLAENISTLSHAAGLLYLDQPLPSPNDRTEEA